MYVTLDGFEDHGIYFQEFSPDWNGMLSPILVREAAPQLDRYLRLCDAQQEWHGGVMYLEEGIMVGRKDDTEDDLFPWRSDDLFPRHLETLRYAVSWSSLPAVHLTVPRQFVVLSGWTWYQSPDQTWRGQVF